MIAENGQDNPAHSLIRRSVTLPSGQRVVVWIGLDQPMGIDRELIIRAWQPPALVTA